MLLQSRREKAGLGAAEQHTTDKHSDKWVKAKDRYSSARTLNEDGSK